MAHVRRFTRGVPSGSRRKTSWGPGPTQSVPIEVTGAGALVWAAGSATGFDGRTIVRIRGEFTLALSVVTTIGDGFNGIGMGICNVSENAFDVGVTAVPSPITDLAWDGWMWHQLLGEFHGASTTELGVGPMEAVRMPIDTKAMRKVKATDVLIGVIELGLERGAATLRMSARTRVLDKLP